MDDFEAPSFSLGLDEEIHGSPTCHATPLPSNPFKISAPLGDVIVSRAVNAASSKGMGNTDYDSDFELPPPSSTERVMKQPKRKSEQSALAPSNNQEQAHHASSIGNVTGLGSQSLGKGSNEKKTSLARKIPTRKAAESNVQTLQNLWQGLNSKTTVKSPADSGHKNFNESTAHCMGQRFASMPVDPVARMNGSQTGASQVCEGATLNFSSDQYSHASKAGVFQGYAKSPCGNEDGLPSRGCAQRPCGRKEDLLEKLGTSMSDTLQSFESCIDVDTHEELPIKNVEQNRTTMHKSPGNGLCNQRAGLHQGAPTSGKGMAETFQKKLDENCNFLDGFSPANSSKKIDPPMQSFWRTVDAKTRTPAGLDLECPADANQIKTNAMDTSHTKTNALHSFWRSLNERKSSSAETNIGVEDDSIESCSSDDDLEFGAQSARKLSLCVNATTKKSFGLGNSAADHNFGRSSGNSHPIKTSTNAGTNNSSASKHPPNTSMADARPTPRSVLHSAANTFSASPKTFQSSAGGDALRGSYVHNLDKFQAKQTSFSKKLPEATPENISWPDDEFLLPRILDEDSAFNDCATSSHAFEVNAGSFGGSSSSSVNPVFSNDSRVADLLRIRFPHFRSISASRKGDFLGSEQVYIDYGNQFSGDKATSSQSRPKLCKQDTRQAAPRSSMKWRKASQQKKQKIAMADNDGWIQTGNRNPSRNRATKNKKGRKGSQECVQTPVSTDFDSSVGAGHWVTERSGKRIYITKDGKKLSGSSAYKQHIKDSGKHFKKTKRRRPRNKK